MNSAKGTYLIMACTKHSKFHKEAGNVLFLILIAVALFAAISFAVTSGSRTNTSSPKKTKNKVDSAAIRDYGGVVENAITKLTVIGNCTPEEMSFERAPFDGSDSDYVNAASPSDKSCHVFHPDGGGVVALPAPRDTNDGSDWAYIQVRVLGIGADQGACGTDCHELAIVLPGLTKIACERINDKLLGSETIPVQDDGNTYEALKFTGSFSVGANIDGGAASYAALCTEDSTGEYYYYHVVYPR